ncbi:MAG: HWE histidine kinase domain-containing protein, partial [Nitrospirota bacterium]
IARRQVSWDQGQHDIFGVDAKTFVPTAHAVKALIHPDDLPRLLDTFDNINVRSKTLQTEFRVCRPNGDVRLCIGVAAASFDDKGRLTWLSGVTVDITERKRAEEHRMLLADEVDHRARNVVSVIQAMMRLTHSDSIDEYIGKLDGRIRALSTTHKLLATSRWDGADLRRLVDEELAPYHESNGDRVGIAGPSTMLAPSTAQTIALALHELVTNAAKYGALSVDSGHIDVTWEIGTRWLILRWVESNGPPIVRPHRCGYGTRVIKGGIEGQLGGKADFEWLRDGLHCVLTVPYSKARAPVFRRMVSERMHDNGIHATARKESGPNRYILLVEDEPTISMMLADMLISNGQQVDGPYSELKEALVAATHNNLHAGILDINLNGHTVYPVADVLTKRNIPFIFVTGYGTDAIEPRYNHVPVMQKPVEPEIIWAALEQLSCKASQ